MTKLHVIAYYTDGYAQVAYCKKCSAEGDKLLEDCEGSLAISSDQRKMAMHLNLHPDLVSSWPMDIIDRLILIEKNKGQKEMLAEIRKMIASS